MSGEEKGRKGVGSGSGVFSSPGLTRRRLIAAGCVWSYLVLWRTQFGIIGLRHEALVMQSTVAIQTGLAASESMELEGVVHNGVIVPNEPADLPKGTRVRIRIDSASAQAEPSRPRRSLLDIAPIGLGLVLAGQSADDDLLGEMLEDRQ
jgi:hypothetical protein